VKGAAGTRLSAIGAATLLSLGLGLFVFYEPFAPRTAGPVVIAAAPIAR
jgi:hypothetical protein